MWKFNDMFLTNQWIKEEITREIRKYLETFGKKKPMPNFIGVAKAVLMEICSYNHLHKN